MRPRLILFMLALILLTVAGEQGAWRLFHLKKRARQLEQANQSLMVENTALVGEIQHLKEPDYLERLIREERGYIRDGENLIEIPTSQNP